MRTTRKPRASKHLGSLANEALLAALGEDGVRDLNISAVARAFGCYTCKVWHYFRGRNKWPAEEWIQALIVLGLVHEARGRFEIYLPKTKGLCRAYDQLKGASYRRKRGVLPGEDAYVMPPVDTSFLEEDP